MVWGGVFVFFGGVGGGRFEDRKSKWISSRVERPVNLGNCGGQYRNVACGCLDYTQSINAAVSTKCAHRQANRGGNRGGWLFRNVEINT